MIEDEIIWKVVPSAILLVSTYFMVGAFLHMKRHIKECPGLNPEPVRNVHITISPDPNGDTLYASCDGQLYQGGQVKEGDAWVWRWHEVNLPQGKGGGE